MVSQSIEESLTKLVSDFDSNLNTKEFYDYIEKWSKRVNNMTEDMLAKKIIQSAHDRIDVDQPEWTFVAARELSKKLYRETQRNRNYTGKAYGDFYALLHTLKEQGIYSSEFVDSYTKEECDALEKTIDQKKDKLFTYIGLFLLADRYLARDHDKNLYELPQERFMVIAMNLMRKEDPAKRLELVKEAYWALSNLYMTVATPTLANAGKTHGQMSSCFIDTVEDSIEDIYLNNFDVARLSKDGGGLGVYFGKVRALGSDIKRFKENSSGVVPWIKGLNQTAVSVDQLGQRKGAIAVYLDIFHKDITHGFLDLKTNNGDERRKAHDIFTGVSIPNLFMEKLEEVDENGKSIGEWHTFCPHQVKQWMGWKDEQGNPLGLEDFYDEVDTNYFTEKYEEAVNHPLLPRETMRAMDVMKKIMIAQLETGTPYMFYRDTVNQDNPNKHNKGIGRTSIYSSNLCTEIMQNMSPTQFVKEYEIENGRIVIERIPGDFVVCNLSSINLARAVTEGVLERLIPIQVRMLDNVIDLNTISVIQAQITNRNYRAIGLGTFGWHHLLALEGIDWGSEASIRFADELYENIAYLTIQASMNLSKEKSAYPKFENSEWQTGAYFKRKYTNEEGQLDSKWGELHRDIVQYGMRNGYLMAVAPNSSTSLIAGSSASIDPIYGTIYQEEKKNFKFNITAPDVNTKTYPYYWGKTRYEVDQVQSIKQNAARQKHIDQAQSFNIYVMNDITAVELLTIHLQAWKNKLKTTYYVRSTSQAELPECEMCSS